MKKKLVNKLNEMKQNLLHFFKYNKQFCSFTILSLISCICIRGLTVGNWFSLYPLLFDIGIIIIIASFAYFIKPKHQFKYFAIMLFVVTLINVINSIYYTFYTSYASFGLLATIGQVGEVTDSIFEKMRFSQFIYILFLIIFVYINRVLSKSDYFDVVTKIEKGKKLFGSTIFIGIIFVSLSICFLSKTDYSRLTKQWNREYIVERFGILVYQGNDLVQTLRNSFTNLFGYDEAMLEFNEYYEENTRAKSHNEYSNIFEGKDVIFVHMESIMSFFVNLKVKDIEVTPNLNKLVSEGLYFSHFYPQISVGTSSDTEFTLNTSLMPVQSGTVFVSYYNREYNSIPKMLSEKGYYTFSMHGNKKTMWNRNNMHASLGYMDFYAEDSFILDENIGLGLSDESFFNQLVPMIENINSEHDKFMGTIITLSNHTPFDDIDKYLGLDLTYSTNIYDEQLGVNKNVTFDYLENTTLGNYIKSTNYADYALGEFIKLVESSSAFDDTVFVFYGDHDAKLSRKEFDYYYNFDFSTGEIKAKEDETYIEYDYYMHELNKNTPLIIWTKDKTISGVVDYYMGMIDVMPTIGNMLGIYNKYALGNDIFEIKDNNIVSFPNGNFLTNKLYYNNTKGEYKVFNDEIIDQNYIDNCKNYTETILEVSNNLIVYDLKKRVEEK